MLARFIAKTASIRAYVYARQGAPLWGSLALPRLQETAAVNNRRAGCQPAPLNASDSTLMSRRAYEEVVVVRLLLAGLSWGRCRASTIADQTRKNYCVR